jgi:hypothetical protein
MWLLFVPILILVVLVLSIGAGVVAMVGAGWPWILIAMGVWMFWHEDGRHHRTRQARREWARASGPVPQVSGDRHGHRHDKRGGQTVDKPKPESVPTPKSELPIDVQVKVEQIRRKVDVLLGYADRFPPFSQDLYLVRQTASDYLPRTIDTYLAMVDKQAAEKPMTPEGKTPHQELKAQLDLLDSKLDDIAQDLDRQDADRLLANRRFLEQRFGMRDPATHVDIA